MTATLAPPAALTVADVLERLGSVPPSRIPIHPALGSATEADVLFHAEAAEKRLYELVDGVLVEKPPGFYESVLASVLIHRLATYLDTQDLGCVAGEAGALRLAPGLVRIPDVSFIAWERFPGRKLPKVPIPHLAPDLAVEILSSSNTEAEMARKLREYFAAGARLVWIVDPETRTARVFTDAETHSAVTTDGVLDGGDVLPGFQVSLREWFERAGER